jgi:hypothetical protein
MEPSRHIIRKINRGFESSADNSRNPFLTVACKFRSFLVGAGASWRIENRRNNERVICYTEANGAYGAKGGGYSACYGVGGALIVEVFGRIVSREGQKFDFGWKMKRAYSLRSLYSNMPAFTKTVASRALSVIVVRLICQT